jgi:hypothetical protein
MPLLLMFNLFVPCNGTLYSDENLVNTQLTIKGAMRELVSFKPVSSDISGFKPL